jgi:hypothetical protein
MQMRAINRKQVPLCTLHHHKLHNDSLDENNRSKIREYVEVSKRKKNPNGRAV